MYKIVFLLIFSAVTATKAKEIVLDIAEKYNTETGMTDVLCQKHDTRTQTALISEKITLSIQTRTKLVDFWCHNINGTLIYNPTVPEQKDVYGKMEYKLSETSVISDMNGTWKCTFKILKNSDDKDISTEYDNYCYFQVQIIEPPGVSLNIKQLSGWTWINQNQGRKQYNYSFTEDEAQFDCVLNNPTEHEETYAIYFFMDEPQNGTNITETLQPHDQVILSGTFKLVKDKRILCKAVNKKGKGMDLLTEINLHYVPPSRVLLNIHTVGSAELKMGKLIRENNTQMYDYEFTDGEQVKIRCTLNEAGGDEMNYGLTLCIKHNKPRGCITETHDTSISDIFKLQKGDEFIQCTATNKLASSDPSLPSYLYNIINLHHIPPRDDRGSAPLLSFTESEKLQRLSDTIYRYYFTAGENLTLNCSLRNDARIAGHDAKDKIIYFYLKINGTVNQYRNIASNKDLNTPTSLKHTFTLKKSNHEAIICAAYNGKIENQTLMDSIKVILQERPPRVQTYIKETNRFKRQGFTRVKKGWNSFINLFKTTPTSPMLSITGPEKLLPWSNPNTYYYNFTDHEIVEFKCSLNNAVEDKKNYDVVLYNYNVSNNTHDVITSSKVLKSACCVSNIFRLEKEAEAISCAVFEINDDDKNIPVLKTRIEVRLHYYPSQDFFKLDVEGSSELQEVSNSNGVYSYEFSNDETITVDAAINITEKDRDNYVIQFYLDGNEVKHQREDRVLNGGSKRVVVALKKNNTLLACVVTNKKNNKRIQQTINLNYKKKKPVSGLEIKIEGLPDDSCRLAGDLYKINKICNYTFGDPKLLGTSLPLKCIWSRTKDEARKEAEYKIEFGTSTVTKKYPARQYCSREVSHWMPRTAENKTVTCKVTKGNIFTAEIHVYYIPWPTSTTTTTTTEPPTVTTTTETAVTSVQPPTDTSLQSNPDDDSSKGWIIWVLGGGALLITICVVVGCIVMYRQKKPPPADTTYANLSKDQSTYQTVPVAAPRTMQKPNVTQNPNAAGKPKVSLENNYSEPKDSQDMSEALYADPNRFNGDSETYAEPYVKSKPSPKTDTYAEPYKSNYAEPYASNSEGNYAELSLPNTTIGRELYAKPIPKAQRKPKVKNDSNYSNVFGDEYANTKK